MDPPTKLKYRGAYASTNAHLKADVLVKTYTFMEDVSQVDNEFTVTYEKYSYWILMEERTPVLNAILFMLNRVQWVVAPQIPTMSLIGTAASSRTKGLCQLSGSTFNMQPAYDTTSFSHGGSNYLNNGDGLAYTANIITIADQSTAKMRVALLIRYVLHKIGILAEPNDAAMTQLHNVRKKLQMFPRSITVYTVNVSARVAITFLGNYGTVYTSTIGVMRDDVRPERKLGMPTIVGGGQIIEDYGKYKSIKTPMSRAYESVSGDLIDLVFADKTYTAIKIAQAAAAGDSANVLHYILQTGKSVVIYNKAVVWSHGTFIGKNASFTDALVCEYSNGWLYHRVHDNNAFSELMSTRMNIQEYPASRVWPLLAMKVAYGKVDSSYYSIYRDQMPMFAPAWVIDQGKGCDSSFVRAHAIVNDVMIITPTYVYISETITPDQVVSAVAVLDGYACYVDADLACTFAYMWDSNVTEQFAEFIK
jgi:hypothetical protein